MILGAVVRVAGGNQIDQIVTVVVGVIEFAPREGHIIRRLGDVDFAVRPVDERAVINPDVVRVMDAEIIVGGGIDRQVANDDIVHAVDVEAASGEHDIANTNYGLVRIDMGVHAGQAERIRDIDRVRTFRLRVGLKIGFAADINDRATAAGDRPAIVAEANGAEVGNGIRAHGQRGVDAVGGSRTRWRRSRSNCPRRGFRCRSRSAARWSGPSTAWRR